MNSKTYKLPNGKKAVFEYDVCGIGKITLDGVNNGKHSIGGSRSYTYERIGILA